MSPADVAFAVTIGAGGLNLRDQPVTVPPSELTDSLNWELDEHAAPIKRLGYVTYEGSSQIPAVPLEVTQFTPASGATNLVFYCADGHVYASPGDGTYTSIASGLSTSARPCFAKMNGVLYWANGVDTIQQWDGATLTTPVGTSDVQTITITGTPTSGYFALGFGLASTQQVTDVQTVSMTGNPTSGTFKITFNGQQTASINWNDTSPVVQAALEALSTIGSGNIVCTGGPFPATAITCTFAGPLASQPQTVMTVANSLTGGTAQVSHDVTGIGLTYAATATQVQTALRSLYTIGSPNVICSGGPLPGTPIVCTFAGTLANAPMPLLTHAQTFAGGSSPTLAVSHTTTGVSPAPKGKYLAVWRNRVWVAGDPANPYRVYWSDIGGTWSNSSVNYVDLFGPYGEAVTGLAANPGSSSFDGFDSILVFQRHSMHRILDDSDNINGIISGGSNVLVDPSNGCVENRSIAFVNGRTYCVSVNGIRSTDGKSPLHLESAKLGRFFEASISRSETHNLAAISYQNRYRLACTKTGDTANSLVLDIYTALPRDKTDGDAPIMAHAIPIAAWVVHPSETIYFCDSSAGNQQWVRHLGVGGSDTSGAATPLLITASAVTGASLFGSETPKRMRRLVIEGRGQLTIGVVADLANGVGESKSFDLAISSAKWGSVKWGSFKWGASGSSTSRQNWYTARGRFFNFTLNETSSDVGTTRSTLGAPVTTSGGAALYSLLAWVTPLDAQ